MPRLRKTPRADHESAAEALREMPGLWLTVKVYPANYSAQSLAVDVGRGRYAYTPAGAYEARTELVDDGTAVLVRYVGELADAQCEQEAA
ncbi:hypothetical protein [Streptomyces sp. NPDC001404]|uniref:hypothetical protein n=1 Tax=Streptomyces sp. NPDC001404 TaxID=3364571 RepID=UPI00367D8140